MAEQQDVNLGRKVFFLYPPSVIQEELVRLIIRAGYEVYVLRDHHKAKAILKAFPGSIMFINIDVVQNEIEWQRFSAGILKDSEILDARLGVVTYNLNQRLQEHYLKNLRVPCGFIHMKQNQLESLAIIIKVLELNEARGIRRHIRAECTDDFSVTFYTKIGNVNFAGKVKDLSESGMACVFEKEVSLPEKQKIPEIHLNLRGAVCRLPAIVYAHKSGEPVTYVMLFEKDLDNDTKDKIYSYISANIQHQMDQKIRELQVDDATGKL